VIARPVAEGGLALVVPGGGADDKGAVGVLPELDVDLAVRPAPDTPQRESTTWSRLGTRRTALLTHVSSVQLPVRSQVGAKGASPAAAAAAIR
jgi:hypothetical protein